MESRFQVEVYLWFLRDTASIDLGSMGTSSKDDHAILRSVYQSMTTHDKISNRATCGEGYTDHLLIAEINPQVPQRPNVF